MPKQYAFNGFDGCVVLRKSRVTGLMVGLYQADQAGMDPDAGKWATVCEDHGHIVNHDSLSVAQSHLAAPDEWCEVCIGTERA